MVSENMKKIIAGSSAIREMFEEGARLVKIHGRENVFDFSIGNPSAETPAEIKQAIKEILDDENLTSSDIHGYMNNSGYGEVRAKIADSINKEFGTKFSEKNVLMTVGAAGALNIVFKTLLDPGDEVIVIAPYFGEYNNYVANSDGRIVVTNAEERDFQPDLNALEEKISQKTKAVIINTPNNPSGAVYPEETLKAIAELLERKQREYNKSIYLVSDEPYRKIVFDGIKVPYVTHYYRNTFVANSYSKSLSLPGERIGYLLVPPEMDGFEEIAAALNIANRILGFVNAPSLFQRVAARCVDLTVDLSEYEKNRDCLLENFGRLGIECVRPRGTFYLFPKSPIADDKKFCEDAKGCNILIVPGSAFGYPGYFRLAYCTSNATVKNSIPAFERLMKKY